MSGNIDPEWRAEHTITPEEEVLASYLYDRGIHFERQYEIHRPGAYRSYWLDFAMPRWMLAIEIDGHPINLEREAFLVDLGWKIIHLQNEHFRTRKIQTETWAHLASLIASFSTLPKGERR